MPILDAGVKQDKDGYDIYQEGIEKGYFVEILTGPSLSGGFGPVMRSSLTLVGLRFATGGLSTSSSSLTWAPVGFGMTWTNQRPLMVSCRRT